MNFTTYVLDTSVLLSAGKKALYSFPENRIVIPLTVVKELESKRNDPELGLAARSVLRELDDLRNKGDIKKGVSLGDNSEVRIEVNHIDNIPDILRAYASNDVKIITVAKYLSDQPENRNVILVSKDLTLKITASLVDVKTQDFVPMDLESDHIDSIGTVYVTDDAINEIHATGSTRLDLDVPINASVILRSMADDSKTALAIAKANYEFVKVNSQKIFKLDPKGAEQGVATHYLMDPKIKIVSLGGRAGTGKTSLALAAGLAQVDAGLYKKVTVFRSMHAVGGEELGFLPGTAEEKLSPWEAAIWDSLGSFLDAPALEHHKRQGHIEVLPLTHIRGRNLNGRFMLLDEAQNLERSTIMTALSRAGAGTKAVMSWDVSQRDNFRVGRHDGVYEVASRLLGEKLFAHVSLQKSQRSDVAELVSRKLDDYGV
jgi:PhoH-like ATPase